MKDTNKLVIGVTTAFVVISAVAVSQGGSLLVSAACTLAAFSLSLAYKYKCERDNGLDLLDFMQRTILTKNNRINVLEEILMKEIDKCISKELTSEEVEVVKAVKKPRQSKNKVKTELV